MSRSLKIEIGADEILLEGKHSLRQGVCEEMKDCILYLWNTVILQQGSRVFSTSRNAREGREMILFLKQEEKICSELTVSFPVFASN